MTLGEGKRKVLMLLDEYSSGGELTVDEDIEKKMADFSTRHRRIWRASSVSSARRRSR